MLLYVVSHLWLVKPLQDHLLCLCLAELTTYIVIFSEYSLCKTPQYIQFSFVHWEATKAIYQHIVASILTVNVMPVPSQLRIMLLLKPKLIEEVKHSSVCG